MRLSCLLLFAGLLALEVNGISFYLKPRETKCLSEDVSVNELVLGEFSVAPTSQGTEVRVSDPDGRELYSKRNQEEGRFAFTCSVAGEHRVCFTNNDGVSKTITFTLSTGVDAKDYSDVAKKENLKPLEVQLKKLEDTVASIHKEMLYMKGREEVMRNTNESTNSRVLWFSFFSMAVLAGLTAWQVYYLKRFFKRKKMI